MILDFDISIVYDQDTENLIIEEALLGEAEIYYDINTPLELQMTLANHIAENYVIPEKTEE